MKLRKRRALHVFLYFMSYFVADILFKSTDKGAVL